MLEMAKTFVAIRVVVNASSAPKAIGFAPRFFEKIAGLSCVRA